MTKKEQRIKPKSSLERSPNRSVGSLGISRPAERSGDTRFPLDQVQLNTIAKKLAKKDRVLGDVYARFGPPPMWKRPATFATFVRIILEQQVTLQAAWSTFKRLDESCGAKVTAAAVTNLGENGLRKIGFSRQKARYAIELAENVAAKRFSIGSLRHQDDTEVRRRIVSQLGLGNWSADIYLLMALRRRDVFPIGDLAIVKGIRELDDQEYESPAQILERAESWRPYRSVATRMIWQHYLNRNRPER